MYSPETVHRKAQFNCSSKDTALINHNTHLMHVFIHKRLYRFCMLVFSILSSVMTPLSLTTKVASISIIQFNSSNGFIKSAFSHHQWYFECLWKAERRKEICTCQATIFSNVLSWNSKCGYREKKLNRIIYISYICLCKFLTQIMNHCLKLIIKSNF